MFLVGGGQAGDVNTSRGGNGCETIFKKMYLTSTSTCSVTIGAGGVGDDAAGTSSVFVGSSSGGSDVTAIGGASNSAQARQQDALGAGWAAYADSYGMIAGSGVFGYGAGGTNTYGGVAVAKANSGQGTGSGRQAGSGYCLIKWYE